MGVCSWRNTPPKDAQAERYTLSDLSGVVDLVDLVDLVDVTYISLPLYSV